MAQRSVSAFKATKDSRYADNTSGDVSAEDSRNMFEDTADSFLNITDHFIDEDDMASDSATKVPSQQSVKAYVDAEVSGIVTATSGTYTPSITNTTNVDEADPHGFRYTRVGDVVTVYGWIIIEPDTAAETILELSLPIPSNLSGLFNEEVVGMGLSGNNGENVFINGVPANDTVRVRYFPSGTTQHGLALNFSYLIVT